MLVLFLVDGFARVVFALMIRPMDDWLWVLASGLVAVACAAVLLANLPEAASWLLGFLLGLHLISAGGALGLLAWNLRRAGAEPLRKPDPGRRAERRLRARPARDRHRAVRSARQPPRSRGSPPGPCRRRRRRQPRRPAAAPAISVTRAASPRSTTRLETRPVARAGSAARRARGKIERRDGAWGTSLRWAMEGATWLRMA